MKNGRKVATTKDKNNKYWETNGANNSLGIKIPTKRLFEKSGVGNIRKPPTNPIMIEK